MAGQVPDLDEAGFDKFVSDTGVAVVDFWAPWCGPCHKIAPIVAELAEELDGKVAFGKLNTDENQAVAQRLGIMSIPTLMVFKAGQKVDQIVGVMPKNELKARIDAVA